VGLRRIAVNDWKNLKIFRKKYVQAELRPARGWKIELVLYEQEAFIARRVQRDKGFLFIEN